MAFKFTQEDVHDVPDEAFQPPRLTFPRRQFGISAPVNRAFQAAWFNHFNMFKWLHYDIRQDSAYCFVCCKAVKERKVELSSYVEESFLVKGFTNWMDATRIFVRHENCEFHRLSAAALANRVNVGDMLSKQAATEKQQNRQYLLKVLTSIRFLGCQGLPFCGDGDETDSTLHQLLFLSLWRGLPSHPSKTAAEVYSP